jgi:hypothetical protein
MKFIIRQCAPQLGGELQLVTEDGFCVIGNKAKLLRALEDADVMDLIRLVDSDGREQVTTVWEYRR